MTRSTFVPFFLFEISITVSNSKRKLLNYFFNFKRFTRLETELFFGHYSETQSVTMQNEAGEYVDMYIPRKW